MADRDAEARKFSHQEKALFWASLALLLVLACLTALLLHHGRERMRQDIAALDAHLIATQSADLRRLVSFAHRVSSASRGADPAAEAQDAKARALRLLGAMRLDGDFGIFVLDDSGQALLPPQQAGQMGLGALQDPATIATLIEAGRQGDGVHRLDWTLPEPEEGEPGSRRVIAQVSRLEDWGWTIGAAAFVEDVLATGQTARAEVQARIMQSLRLVGGSTAALVLGLFLTGLLLYLRDRRLADRKLKALTQRIFDTQEEERGRVARELHDSISQILVGARYTLELARRRFSTGDTRAGEALDQGIDILNGAIHEVRRISRDLRPGLLDDLGLGPALQSLAEDFGRRTGIEVEFVTNPFRNRLDPEAKTALYRIAQEALTNVERHSGATQVKLLVRGTSEGAVVRIEDNGHGMPATRRGGLGLRNMAERMAQLDGRLRVVSTRSGTLIEAQVPLTHMLPPNGTAEAQA